MPLLSPDTLNVRVGDNVSPERVEPSLFVEESRGRGQHAFDDASWVPGA